MTIDYGPFGFLDQFDLGFICNRSDRQGQYRFDRQPETAHWNLLALCTALQSVIPWETSQEILKSFLPSLIARYHDRMMDKLGLPNEASAAKLWQDFLIVLQKSQADYHQSFRALVQWVRNPATELAFAQTEGADDWLGKYRSLLQQHGTATEIAARMDGCNPRYILRNWIAEDVIRAIEDDKNAAPLHRLAEVLKTPYDAHPDCVDWREPPSDEYAGLTISCSS